jgi:hypothetical protein
LLSSSNETFAVFSSSVDDRLDIAESFSSSINTTIKTKLDVEGVVSGSSQINFTELSGISANIISASSDTANVDIIITGGSISANLTGGVVSGSSQLTGSLVDLTSEQTISGTKTFNDIVVNGTGSFAYIQSVTGSAKIIGDAYVLLNNNTPSERYAGIAIYDSGSATPTTASFNFDGQTNDWFYEYSASNVDYAVTLFGPEYNTKGSPTYLTTNKIPKSDGTHHLNDSNITDTGTLITLGSNTNINGTIYASGTPLVSGSSQITLSSTTGGDTSANVQFGSLGIGMAASGTAGRIDATNDIVAYSSSDRRFKENITPIENALEKINQIGGYEFDWKDENKIEHGYEGHDLGVIAQEIEAIAPELVQTRENGYKAVKYDKLVSVLIQAVKELSAKVSELENK